jgi:hypothetical protein
MRVLIVEDNVRMAELLAEGPGRRGFSCDAAHDLAAADDHLAVTRYDESFLDLGLSDGDENQQRAAAQLSLMAPVSPALIFIVLFATLGSLRQSLLILANIPAARRAAVGEAEGRRGAELAALRAAERQAGQRYERTVLRARSAARAARSAADAAEAAQAALARIEQGRAMNAATVTEIISVRQAARAAETISQRRMSSARSLPYGDRSGGASILIHADFTSTNLSMARSDLSEPFPDCLTPPRGTVRSDPP